MKKDAWRPSLRFAPSAAAAAVDVAHAAARSDTLIRVLPRCDCDVSAGGDGGGDHDRFGGGSVAAEPGGDVEVRSGCGGVSGGVSGGGSGGDRSCAQTSPDGIFLKPPDFASGDLGETSPEDRLGEVGGLGEAGGCGDSV